MRGITLASATYSDNIQSISNERAASSSGQKSRWLIQYPNKMEAAGTYLRDLTGSYPRRQQVCFSFREYCTLQMDSKKEMFGLRHWPHPIVINKRVTNSKGQGLSYQLVKIYFLLRHTAIHFPAQACACPEGSRRVRFLDFKTIGTWK